ncbi:MAG: tyrosine-type recombinase/integrase [Pseudomonadota bacterium]
MNRKLPKGVSSYIDRHGVRRWRYKARGRYFQLGRDFASEEFWRRLTAAHNGQATQASVVQRVASDSLEAVARSFLVSPKVQAWAPLTRSNYGRVIEELRREHGHRSVAKMQTRHVEAIMAEKADTPSAANMRRKVLSRLCKHAMRLGIVDRDVAAAAETYKVKGDGFHTWSEGEVARFLDVHRPGSLAHTAFSLMLYTGAARVDAVKLGWRNVEGDRFVYRREKTKGTGGVAISIPIVGDLAALLRAIPRDRMLFLETAQGRARSPDGLGNLMREWCDKAGLPNCTAHGLRKACARRLAEAGCTPHEIAAITGHKSLAEVERYTRAAGRAGLADAAIEKLGAKRS